MGGPTTFGGLAYPKGTKVHQLEFFDRLKAVISLRGQGTSDLDCFLVDPQGRTILTDTRSGDACYFEWTPSFKGTYTLQIVNRGDAYNTYSVTTN